MPLKKIVLKAGINRDQTNYAGEGGWYAGDKVRFFSGFPEKIGGWAQYSFNTFAGACRSLFNWTSTIPTTVGNYLALGTSDRVYVEYARTINNITPLRPTTPSLAVTSITTTAGSPVITVNFGSAHAAAVNNYVCFTGLPTYDGILNTTLNSNNGFKILSVASTTLTVNTGTSASVGGTSGSGGTAFFEIDVGVANTLSGYGWGVPDWGGVTSGTGWGTAALTPVNVPLRLVYFDKYVDDLFFNIRFGQIYYWNLTNTFSTSTRAVLLSSLATASDVPTQVTQILFEDNANILMAFGAIPYDDTPPAEPFDPLLIRWASQANYLNWTPSDDPGISTAGYLRVQSGSRILKAISNLGEIIVFTESSVTSVQYTAAFPLLFSQRLISNDVTLIGPNAAIAVNNIIYWMGHDKFFMYTGRTEPLSTTLSTEVFNNINRTQSEQFFATTNERFNEIWWFYCSSGSSTIDRYVVYDYFENIWHYGTCSRSLTVPFDTDFVRTSWTDSSLRPYPQAAAEDGYLYNHEFGTDADTKSLPAYLSSADFDIDDGNSFSLIRRIIPDVSFTGSTYGAQIPVLNMTILPRDFPGAPYDQFNAANQNLTRTAISLVVNQFTEQVFVRARARQLAISISSDALGTAWQLGAPRVDIRQDGTRGYNNALASITYWGSQLTDGADTMTALVEPPFVVGVSSATTDGTDIMSSLIGVNVAFTPVALYDAGLASSYPGSGTTWTDISGNGRNATLVNPSYSGGAFTFSPANNGTSSGPYGVIPTSVPTALNVSPATGFTVSIWFKMTSEYGLSFVGNEGLLNSGPWYDQGWPGMLSSAPAYVLSPVYIGSVPPGSDSYISAWVNTGAFGYDVNNSPTKNNARGFGPKAGRWYNLVYTYTGTSSTAALDALRLYIDGVLVGTNSIDASGGYLPITFPTPVTATLNIGANSHAGGATPARTQYMDGSIAVVSIYKPFLNASQVAALYNAYSSRFTNSTYIPVSPAMVTANAVAIYDTDVNKYDEIPNYTLTSSSNRLYDPPQNFYQAIEKVYDFSGNGYDLLQTVSTRIPYINHYNYTDPLNPDSSTTTSNFGGRGTMYFYSGPGGSSSLRYNTLTSGPLDTILTTDASFSVNIWYYHTWLGMTDRPQCISALSNNNSIWFTIGKPEAADAVGTVRAAIAGNSVWYKTPPFSPSLLTWYQYTMTYNATSKLISFYVNGVLFSTVSATGIARTVPSLKGIQVGGRWDNGFTDTNNTMRGNWANAQIYSSVLTSTEILQNYNHFLPRFI